jgi:signal transduction histidine kinase/CheY-like chemotaxis protein
VLLHLNDDRLWRRVILYEPDGTHQILDASPRGTVTDERRWLGRLLGLDLRESRLQIAAGPRVYAILAVTPSLRRLEAELWAAIRSIAVETGVLLGVLLTLMNLILVYGLRPIQALGQSAARLGAGDLTVRMPETALVEIAPTVNAFNSMATNLGAAMASLELREVERQQAERRRAARFGVTRVLAETDTIDLAMAGSLEVIGRALEWDRGEFWRVDAELGVLRRLATWPAAGTAANGSEVARGEGLLGRVWADGAPAWGDDGSVAFPVQSREVTGVIVFVHRDPIAKDDELLPVLTDIGRQIGQFLERRDAEETLRATEEQLRQAQKMEAIGKLAGGIAHDFNNLLTVIMGRCSLLTERLDSRDRLRRDLDLVRKTAERAATLTRQLLAFSRKQVLQPCALELNVVVEDIVPMLRRLIGEDVELMVRLKPEVGQVMADPSQLEQVIVNLVVNARDAMPNGGRLTIETATADLDAAYVRRHPGARHGVHAVLAISDTGLGMDTETQARIFEPFFTTKEAGKGSGLGLATVYGIVKQSGGTIWVYSEPGQGAVFKVYLPQAEEPAETRWPELTLEPTPRGSETLLLVEDQDEVRELARDILEQHGYTVLDARDGDSAWQLFEAHRDRIDLLLTDVVMPGPSGRVLADKVTAARPDMKVLYMSGYTDQAIVHHGVLEQGIAYLEKPFSIDSLTRAVRNTIDSPPEGGFARNPEGGFAPLPAVVARPAGAVLPASPQQQPDCAGEAGARKS